jgi:glutathione S-transferase
MAGRGAHDAPVITLHTLPGGHGVESYSPFCMKAEVYLKLAKLPYKTRIGNVRKAPKGKLPFIVDDDGTVVADSSAIVAHFEKKHGDPLDKGLSLEEKARAHVLKRTLEESLYFVAVWARWAEDEGFAVVRESLKGIPAAIRWFLVPAIRKNVVGITRAQGIGRHSRDEIYAFGKADIDAVATLLGERPFLLGDRLSSVDVSAYAFFANMLRVPGGDPLRAAVKATPNLEAYVDRIGERVKAAKPG